MTNKRTYELRLWTGNAEIRRVIAQSVRQRRARRILALAAFEQSMRRAETVSTDPDAAIEMR